MKPTAAASPFFLVRRSKIHGTGVFARKAIAKGTRLVEYAGARLSHAEADRRYENKAYDDNHTFLFTVDSRTVIDGGDGGSDARFINHSCAPNCETVIENKRVYVETIRPIGKGDEICYDYMIERDASDPPDIDVIFACRCGAPNCRGSMLLPAKKPKKRRKVAKSAGKKSAPGKTVSRGKSGASERRSGGRAGKTRKKSAPRKSRAR
jgi:hypothetical protein